MATTFKSDQNAITATIFLTILLLAAFVGGYYYYQQKDKDTILDVNIGGKQISAEIEHQ